MSSASGDHDPTPEYLREDNITEECKALVPSLPSEIGWHSSRLYLYQGFWFPIRPLNSLLWARRNFRALDSDIILATTPKSGTTWLKAIMFSLLHRSRYPKRETGFENHPLLTTNPHNLVPFLEGYKLHREVPNLDNPSLPDSPMLFSTHIPYVSLPGSLKDSKCKLVYLCRNPKDTFVSLWHYDNKIRCEETGKTSLEESFDRFCRGVSLYGSYWDHVVEYHTVSMEMPHKVMFLRYEEMKENPRRHLKGLAEFMNCPFSKEEEDGGCVDDILNLCSFENISKLEVNRTGKVWWGMENKVFFRKGEVGDWVNYLTPEMAERLDRITKEKLPGSMIEMFTR